MPAAKLRAHLGALGSALKGVSMSRSVVVSGVRNLVRGSVLGLVLAFIAACGSKPKECDAVRPLVAEVKAALSQLDVAGVQAPGEKLLAALKNVSNPELSILKTRTEQLLETARKAQAPAADPAESQRIVQDLDFYTKAFDNAWGHATEVCN